MSAVAASSGSIRSSILPPWKPIRTIASASYPVKRSSISKTVPASPPRFIEPITTLPSRAPMSSRSSRMSAVPEHAVDAGTRQRDRTGGAAAPSGRAIASASLAGAQRTAGWVVGGDQHQPPGLADQAGRPASRCAASSATRLGCPDAGSLSRSASSVGAHGVMLPPPGVPRARRSSASRPRRPAGRPRPRPPRWRSAGSARSSQPDEQPVAQRTAEGVAGPEAVDDVDRHRRHDDRLVVANAEHPGRSLLDDREARRRRRAARPRPLGLALTDRHLALLEVADRDVDEADRRADVRCASSRDGQNIGR